MIATSLFHISDRPALEVFFPRLSPLFPELGPIVWAIDKRHLPNYLLPRDCPRVTFAATAVTREEDRCRFGVNSWSRVIVIEEQWKTRVDQGTVYRYEFDSSDGFELQDASAGYWVSRREVRPTAISVISDLLAAIRAMNADLRLERNLWPLHDAVAGSTLEYSMIRMRNAVPRPTQETA
jgi:hypothetical protein